MTVTTPSLAAPGTRSWPRTIAILILGLAGFAFFVQTDRTRQDIAFAALIENGRAAAQAGGERVPAGSLGVHSVEGRSVGNSISALAELTYEETMREIEARGSRMSPTLDGHPTYMRCCGVPPGEGTGMNPRFFNCGNGPGAIYHAADDDRVYFIIGRWKVLDYVDGEWRVLGYAENQQYIYDPSSALE